MPYLLARYLAEKAQIEQLRQTYCPAQPEVRLLAVSKTKPAEDIMTLYNAGQRDFGENYLQEALIKQGLLAHFDICWHYIGPIQSNKTKDIARCFNWVHSVDRLKIAQRLNHQRPSQSPPLNICLQVNINEEATKSGFLRHELASVVEPLLALGNLRLRGLMAIPRAEQSFEDQNAAFKLLADTKDALNQQFNLQMDTLSMGMSADLKAAISQGSTIVRIGTAIFGAREKRLTKR